MYTINTMSTIKTLTTRIQNKYDTKSAWDEANWIPLKGELLVYAATDDGPPGIKIGDGKNIPSKLKFIEGTGNTDTPDYDKLIALNIPYVVGTLTYDSNGELQSPEWRNYNPDSDSDKIETSGTLEAINAGTYVTYFKTKDGYCWTDGNRRFKGTVAVSWIINPLSVMLELQGLPSSQIVLYVEDDEKEKITLNYNTVFGGPDLEVSASSKDTQICDVAVNTVNNQLTITAKETGKSTITIKAEPNNSNYLRESIDISVTVVDSSEAYLETASWNDISAISESGNARNYFSIGDKKKITLNGTVGNMTFTNEEFYVYIVDFNHGGHSDITFQGFMKEDTKQQLEYDTGNIVRVALYDAAFTMSSSNDDNSYGGWNDRSLRYSVLGSTDTEKGDASSKTPSTPVTNTLMAALHTDLRANMKPLTVYTATRESSLDGRTIVPTVDYLPLPSEFEIQGYNSDYNNIGGYTEEQNYQTQLLFYAEGNGTVSNPIYRYANNGLEDSLAAIWTRSPSRSDSDKFCFYYYSRQSNHPTVCDRFSGTRYVGDSLGISPMFSI